MAIKTGSQEECNNKTVKLMKRIISDIEDGKVNVENSMYDYSIVDKDESVLEVVLDKFIKYK